MNDHFSQLLDSTQSSYHVVLHDDPTALEHPQSSRLRQEVHEFKRQHGPMLDTREIWVCLRSRVIDGEGGEVGRALEEVSEREEISLEDGGARSWMRHFERAQLLQ